MAAYDDLDMTATDRSADAEHLHGMMVTSGLFRVLGVNPFSAALSMPMTINPARAS